MYKAKIIFWGPDKGGRYTNPTPGYRPQIAIGEIHTSCIVNAEDTFVEIFMLGYEYNVLIELIFSTFYHEKINLNVGDLVELYEGCKKIAEGKITDVL